MFTPNSIPYQQQPGFQRTYRQGRLTLGLFFPLEAFAGDTPSMLDQGVMVISGVWKQAEGVAYPVG